jgi:gliding motility-associated-like protein
MYRGKSYSFLVILLFLLGPAAAQIYAPAAIDSFSAGYNPPSGTDVVYVFNRPVFGSSSTVSIIARSPDESTGWDFIWSVYNKNTLSYEILPMAESGSSSSIDTISTSSGYQVVMTKGSENYTYRVWTVFNDFNVMITNKDNENKVSFGYYNCNSLDLRADTTLIPLTYANPFIDTVIFVPNFYTIRWTTDNPEASNPSSRLITRVYDPPSTDTWYILTLTDRFGLQRKDSVLYESIQSEARISATYVNLSDTTVYNPLYGYYYDNGIKSAPGKYRFDLSASQNAAIFRIDFGDDHTYETTSETEKIIHEFVEPGTYEVTLTTKSDPPFECTDTSTITVDLAYAQFHLPNVFTPNDDGDNDLLTLYENNNVFRSVDVSVVSIDITIFDRSGTKVHQYSGNIRDWPGWDGKIMKSNREAPEGVYYYVITFLYAFENKDDPIGNEVLRGFIHLYRQ